MTGERVKESSSFWPSMLAHHSTEPSIRLHLVTIRPPSEPLTTPAFATCTIPSSRHLRLHALGGCNVLKGQRGRRSICRRCARIQKQQEMPQRNALLRRSRRRGLAIRVVSLHSQLLFQAARVESNAGGMEDDMLVQSGGSGPKSQRRREMVR